uniref:ER membrane protein complex subunit 1 n=1 Tax=Heligmosomoides polygyrus TaxID=6339 RepID=A0A183FLK9_HELPZ
LRISGGISWASLVRLLNGKPLLIPQKQTDPNAGVPSMSCPAIRRRILTKATAVTVKHPIAVSRVVNKDYFWHEAMLSYTYSPQNVYCFAIDAKSEQSFKQRMQSLAECMPNVILAQQVSLVPGKKKACHLVEISPESSVAAYSLNHDLILKTNEEISDAIDILNGSHSIGAGAPTGADR